MYLQRYLVDAWLVPRETAAILVHVMCTSCNQAPIYIVIRSHIRYLTLLFEATYVHLVFLCKLCYLSVSIVHSVSTWTTCSLCVAFLHAYTYTRGTLVNGLIHFRATFSILAPRLQFTSPFSKQNANHSLFR